MKPLTQLINLQKADILHHLFPDEIPALLDFIEGMAQAFRQDSEVNRRSWNNSRYSFTHWLQLAGEAESKISRLRRNLAASHYVFSEQLFTSELADFSIHCLIVYTTTRHHPDPKFTTAVDLLFNP